MSVDNKRKLSKLVYYTLAILTLCFSAFFIYALMMREVAMWAKIIYFIWIGLVVAVVIFDLICTNNGESKHVSGLFVYVLSILAVVMAAVLYFVNTGVAGLTTEFFNLFISVSFISLLTTGCLIATWSMGEKLVERTTQNEEIKSKMN